MFEFRLKSIDWLARTGEFFTAHWSFKTPIFMPVWTKATVKWIENEELNEMWAEIILNNTYHLYLRPWQDIIKDLWGIHKFQNYKKPILTDSWWFQVFSLWEWKRKNSWEKLVKITEDWVHFRSIIDWSKHFFTAESVMDTQSILWADIIMAFDECANWNSTKEYARQAMDRTHRWAIRSFNRWRENEAIRKENWLYPQALFPIIQWVIYDDLRIESTKFIRELDCPWIAIWWLSVWESKEDMYRILDKIQEHIPKEKARYLMWVWSPEDIIEWIYRWIDMFDCVLATRIWRHGTAFTHYWNIRLTNNRYKNDRSPLDIKCICKICRRYSKAYISHLVKEKELLGMQFLSYHNLYFLLDLTRRARVAIQNNNYEEFRINFRRDYKKE